MEYTFDAPLAKMPAPKDDPLEINRQLNKVTNELARKMGAGWFLDLVKALPDWHHEADEGRRLANFRLIAEAVRQGEAEVGVLSGLVDQMGDLPVMQ